VRGVRSKCRGAVGAGLLIASAFVVGSVRGDEVIVVAVAIRDHRFSPSEIHLPAGRAARIDITNEDPTAEEFDSRALKVEKVIAGGKSGSVRIRPLERGRYPFVGEYHPDTAAGEVVAD